MRGSGWVRDLREAMSLATTEAQTLQDSLAAFAAGSTREEQMALADAFITNWARSSGRMVNDTYEYNLVPTDGVLSTADLVSYDAGSSILTLHPQGMEHLVYDPDSASQVLRPTAAGYRWSEHPARLGGRLASRLPGT